MEVLAPEIAPGGGAVDTHEPEADEVATHAAADSAKAAAEEAIERDPASEETRRLFVESQAAAGSYQAARERASAGAAAAQEKFMREHAEDQEGGHDSTEL